MSNVLDAIMNIIQEGSFEAKRIKNTENSINQVGDSLEEYIKDSFSNSFNLHGKERKKAMDRYILYHGNAKNPPDIITAGEDSIAIEVKKSKYKAALQFNSSMPHSKLGFNDTRIKKECRKLLNNKEIDMLYVAGTFNKGSKEKIRHLVMTYGSVYCSEKDIYEKIDFIIRNKIKELSGTLIEISPRAYMDLRTNELGKLKKIDPRGYCDLRIRGMYTYESPYIVFNETFDSDEILFDMLVIVPNNTFQQFKNKDVFLEFVRNNKDITMETKNYPDPNNNNKTITCQKIVYIKSKKE